MTISAIVATARNNAIGKDNDLPWHLPADLKYFKNTTYGKPVLMGRKSFESIGRPLPGRTNIIITRNEDYYHSGVHVCHSISDGLSLAEELGTEELFITGGSHIYEQTMDVWDKLYLTRIDIEVPDATTFFPEIDFSKWKLVREEGHKADEKNPYDYTFCQYERI